MIYNNDIDIPLPLFAAMTYDDYTGHSDNPKYISATRLVKPLRETILSRSSKYIEPEISGSGMMGMFFGKAIHSAIDTALSNPEKCDLSLFSKEMKESLLDGKWRIEKRLQVVINGWTVSSQNDLIVGGVGYDWKFKTTFAYNKKDYVDYKIQGSIIRYIFMKNGISVDRVFKFVEIYRDWMNTPWNKKMPPKWWNEINVNLMSMEQTERYIKGYIRGIERSVDVNTGKLIVKDNELPLCPPEKLWYSENKFKVYKSDASVKAMRGGVFDDLHEATAFNQNNQGSVLKKFWGKPRYCDYCSSRVICSNKSKNMSKV